MYSILLLLRKFRCDYLAFTGNQKEKLLATGGTLTQSYIIFNTDTIFFKLSSKVNSLLVQHNESTQNWLQEEQKMLQVFHRRGTPKQNPDSFPIV